MRSMILVVMVLVAITLSSVYLVATDAETSEEVMMSFLEELLTASPETYEELFKINIFDQLEVDTYVLNHYTHMATERMMKNIVGNATVGIASRVAYETNSKVTVDTIEITSAQTSDNKIYYNFTGVSRVTSIDSNEIYDYPLQGQIGLLIEDEVYKVDTLRLFTINLLDHRMRDIEQQEDLYQN